jgi:release factor glutamine methyltransferase
MPDPVVPNANGFEPTVSPEYADQIRRWHERAYEAGRASGVETQYFDYLEVAIEVPPEVMPITPMSHLLGEAVRNEARSGELVLDMGTGSGVSAILAAKNSARVIAVDINPQALEAASMNAERNGVGKLVDVRRSDVFSSVTESFDLIIFDPPFRWFAPRSLFEAAITDEGYGAMTRFFREARDHLLPNGRMLIFFGTSGDLGYLRRLIAEEHFTSTTVAEDSLEREGWTVEYVTFLLRLTEDARPVRTSPSKSAEIADV